MSAIIIATVVLAAIGIAVGAALVYIGNKFHVEVDERETAIREVLPGNNCGACGFAGCDAVAAAIVKGEADAAVCPVGGIPVTEKINEIMGTKAAGTERKVAFVRCNGSCEHTSMKNQYVGINDCRAVALSGMYPWNCDYGCMGFGTCAAVCPQNAIHINNGVAIVDQRSCIGCGLCAKECPHHLIELIPLNQKTVVRCRNTDKGKDVKAICEVGCIGCRLCTKQCEAGAITVDGNLAHIDYSLCTNCGKCAEKCPQGTITKTRSAS